jgi:HD-GYP domain-containing protein (c-di-GMP phosphodiesterase class II)
MSNANMLRGVAMAWSEEGYIAISSYGRALSRALDERDSITRRHCDRVIELAGGFGRYCNLRAEELRNLRLCALFHDIGMMGIPDQVLHKQGILNADEWAVMRSHPERGQRIVEAIEANGVEEVSLGVRHHHEHFDGSGYPDGLEADAIPFISRVVAVADAYDSLATPLPYRPARGHETIMDILRDESGFKFDPVIVMQFELMITESSRKAASV